MHCHRETAEIWDYVADVMVWKDETLASFRGNVSVDRQGTMLWMTSGDDNDTIECLDLATLETVFRVNSVPHLACMSDMLVVNKQLVVSSSMHLYMFDFSTRNAIIKETQMKKLDTYNLPDIADYLREEIWNIDEAVDWLDIDDSNLITQTSNNKSIITFIHGGDLVVMNLDYTTQDHIDAVPKQPAAIRKQHGKPDLNCATYLPFIKSFLILAHDDDIKQTFVLVYKVPNTTKAKPVKPLVFQYAKYIDISGWDGFHITRNGKLITRNTGQFCVYDLCSSI